MALSLANFYGGIRAWPNLCRLSSRTFCSKTDTVPFNVELLKVLVCPLTKEPLRYDSATNELVSESIGVAYPVKNGIPNLVPQDGRMLNKDTTDDKQGPS